MSPEPPYGQGTRMLTLAELCQWLNITERHARKLVARGAIPYRKVGHLLRFAEQEIEQWSRPDPRPGGRRAAPEPAKVSATPPGARVRVAVALPQIIDRVARRKGERPCHTTLSVISLKSKAV